MHPGRADLHAVLGVVIGGDVALAVVEGRGVVAVRVGDRAGGGAVGGVGQRSLRPNCIFPGFIGNRAIGSIRQTETHSGRVNSYGSR